MKMSAFFIYLWLTFLKEMPVLFELGFISFNIIAETQHKVARQCFGRRADVVVLRAVLLYVFSFIKDIESRKA
jgi:hypothetical protein